MPGPRIVETAEQALSTIVFGLPAMDATHPDFAAASVLNHILGSGDFDARLVEEVRVKRGLTYSIRTALVADTSIAVLLGQLATPHEKSGEAIAVIESELRRMAKDGPSAEEVENAKSVLTGSLLLGIDTSSRLADTLVGLWLDGQGRTALEQRRAAIDSVTITDVRRVGAMLLDPTHMTVVTIGGKAAGRK